MSKLTVEQIEALRDKANTPFGCGILRDEANALCDMALASVRDAEPVAYMRLYDHHENGLTKHSLTWHKEGWNEKFLRPLYLHPTAHPSADELLREIAEHLEARNDDTGLDVIRQKLQARLARSAT